MKKGLLSIMTGLWLVLFPLAAEALDFRYVGTLSPGVQWYADVDSVEDIGTDWGVTYKTIMTKKIDSNQGLVYYMYMVFSSDRRYAISFSIAENQFGGRYVDVPEQDFDKLYWTQIAYGSYAERVYQFLF